MATAPYQGSNLAGERRRAMILRALGGIAEQGPALGTDIFGSFQAGIRGALRQGQAMEEANLQREAIEARRRTEQAARDPFLLTRQKIEWLENRLGRPLTEVEVRDMFDIEGPAARAGRVPLSERITEFEQAMGPAYKASPAQIERLAGTWISPESDPRIPAITGEAKEVASYAKAMGLPGMENVNQPDPRSMDVARAAMRWTNRPGKMSYVPHPMQVGVYVPTASFEGLDPVDIDLIKDIPASQMDRRLFTIWRRWEAAATDSQKLKEALRAGNWTQIRLMAETGGLTGDPRIKEEAGLYLMLSGAPGE